LRFSRAKGQISYFQGIVFIVFFSGLIISALLFCLSLSLFHTRFRAQQMAAKLTAELQESAIKLRELNDSKDKFFLIIGHDLTGPFNSIVGFSNLLVEQIKNKNSEGI
jgi:signal transduction histidine kinase